jgi:hypothetical protein
VRWIGRAARQWLEKQHSAGSAIVGVELADEAIRLGDLPAARQRTIARALSDLGRRRADLVDLEMPPVQVGEDLEAVLGEVGEDYRDPLGRDGRAPGHVDLDRCLATLQVQAPRSRSAPDASSRTIAPAGLALPTAPADSAA